jgi:predicted GNAT family acetyltransferase
MVEIAHNPAMQRYEAMVDGQLAGVASYREKGNDVFFDHTAVEPAFRGRGIARQLVDEALADVRAQGKRPIGVCPFVVGVMDREAELVS